MSGMGLNGQRHVVENGKIEKKRRNLKRAGKAERAARRHRQRRDIAAGKLDAAGIGRELSAELRDQRGLASPVRAYHRMQLPFGNSAAEVVSRNDATEALGKTLDLQQVRHSAPCRANRRCRRVRTARTAAEVAPGRNASSLEHR